LTANATTYPSTYGQNRTNNVATTAGAHTFEVAEIAASKWTEWYVNGVYTGTAENDYSGFLALDPSFSYTFNPGTTTGIKALVYNSDFSALQESHTWNVAIDTTPPTVAITSPTNGQAFTAPFVSVRGTANDPGAVSSGITRVEVRVNGGAWRIALGTGTWNDTVFLALGDNVIEARSWDGAGFYSPIGSIIRVTYLPSEPPPTLNLTRQSANLFLSWPTNDAGFVLESITNLTLLNWALVSTPPLAVGGQNLVTETMSDNVKYYRLRKP